MNVFFIIASTLDNENAGSDSSDSYGSMITKYL